MKVFRIVLLTLLVVLPCAPVSAQGLWQRFVLWLREGDQFDSSYIYQHPVRFQVSLDGALQRVSVDLKSGFDLTCYEHDNEGNVTATAQVPSTITSNMSENINGGFGMGLGYGKLGLGFGLFTWPANAATTTSLNFGYQGHKWGIRVSAYRISQYAKNTITIDTLGTTQWHTVSESQTSNPCAVGRLNVDAYWTIRRNRFAYTAAYKCDMVQRRSAGSLMICAGMLLSALEHQQGDAILMLSDFKGYRNFQSSVGAGYSHNIVFVHHDPTGPHDKGLFNITLNLTILPMLTVYSNLTAVPWSDGDNVRITGQLAPTVTFGGALGFTIGRVFFGTQYRHNLYYFHSASAMSAAELGIEGSGIDNVGVEGLFQDWRLSTIVVVNF